MINLAAILDHHALVRPDKLALAWRGGQYTYARLLERVNAVAGALASRGVREGDHVALLMENTPEFIEAIFAVNRLGAVFLPLNVRLAPAEWRYILQHDGQTSAVVTEAQFEADLAGVLEGLPMDVKFTVDQPETTDFEFYDDAVAAHLGESFPPVDVPATALQRVMYTSGTTARPKGVCITHSNFAWKSLGMLVAFGWSHTDVTVVGGPLYHVGALDMGGLTTLQVGGTVVLQKKFDADNLLALVEQHRGTNCWLAPAMVRRVLQASKLRTRDLSSLRLILSGGEKTPEPLIRQVLDALPDVWFADAYGLTETVSTDTVLDRDHMVSKVGSVGLPLPYQEVRVVDEDGAFVAAGAIGEIVARGPKTFHGYWRDPKATAAAFCHGWFHTGDVGRIDHDGYLYVVDRKKDMIVSGGENIAPAEVERSLYEHPAVSEAAVIGQPDEKWGEVPKAFVVLCKGAVVTSSELRTFCRERLADFKVPRCIELVEALPRTPSGKVLKHQLRAQHETDRAGR